MTADERYAKLMEAADDYRRIFDAYQNWHDGNAAPPEDIRERLLPNLPTGVALGGLMQAADDRLARIARKH